MSQDPSETTTTTVSILEKEYLVSCPPEEREALEQSARHLDRRMREIRANGKVIGLERIAVMAALNITYELLQKQDVGVVTEQQLNRLDEKLTRALADVANDPDADASISKD